MDYFDHYPLPPTNAATPPHTPPRMPTLSGAAAPACSGAGIVPGEHGVGQGSRVEYGGDRPSCMRIAKEGVIVVLKCRATSADADVSDAFTASAPRRGVGDVEDGVCGARSFWSLLGSAGPRGSFGSGTFLLWMRFRTCSEQVMHVDFGAVMRSCRHLM